MLIDPSKHTAKELQLIRTNLKFTRIFKETSDKQELKCRIVVEKWHPRTKKPLKKASDRRYHLPKQQVKSTEPQATNNSDRKKKKKSKPAKSSTPAHQLILTPKTLIHIFVRILLTLKY